MLLGLYSKAETVVQTLVGLTLNETNILVIQ